MNFGNEVFGWRRRWLCQWFTKARSWLGYRMDLLVENLVVVEIKCVEAVHPVHQAQLLSYLRLSEKNVGLLINFCVTHLKDGITRMVDGYGWDR